VNEKGKPQKYETYYKTTDSDYRVSALRSPKSTIHNPKSKVLNIEYSFAGGLIGFGPPAPSFKAV